MKFSAPLRTLHSPLQLQQLESRENPVGNLTTSVSGGVLTLTGTDQNESFIITPLSGNLFTITGQDGTKIDGAASTTSTAAASSIRMSLKGGFDTLAIDDSVAALNLSGALSIDGGDGNNSYDFSTITKATTFGSFTVIGGEGDDKCLIGNTSIGTTIAGDVNFSLGLGSTDVEIARATIGGNYNFKSSIGLDTAVLIASQIGKDVTFNTGAGGSSFTSKSAMILAVNTKTVIGGNLKYVSSVGDDVILLTDTQINGTTGITASLGIGKGGISTDGMVDVTKGGLNLSSISDTILANPGILNVKGSVQINSPKSIVLVNDGTLKAASFLAKSKDGVNASGSGSWQLTQGMSLSTFGNLGIVAGALVDVQLGGSLTASSARATSVDVQSGFMQNVNISCTLAAAEFSHSNTGNLNIKGNVSVRANREANLKYSSSGVVQTAGTTSLTSTSSVATLENSDGQMTLTGPVTVSGYVGGQFKLTSADATGATIQSNVSITSSGGSVGAILNATKAKLNGKLTMIGDFSADVSSSMGGEINVNGDVLVSGAKSGSLDVEGSGNLKLGSKLTINGGDSVGFQMNNSGTNSSIAGDVSLQTNGSTVFKLLFVGKSFAGNVTMKGNDLDFNVNTPTSTSNFAKKLSASSGSTGQGSVVMAGTYNVVGDTTFTIPAGEATVDIAGKGTGVSDFGGNLSIQTGDSMDFVRLNGVAVTGNVSILTKSNRDIVSLDKSCVFGGTVDIDTGSGDDKLNIGLETGLITPAVVFNGKTTIRSGSGNDLFSLGTALTSGGDSRSIAVFNVLGSSLDGGLGFDAFTDNSLALPITNLATLGF